MSNYNSVIKCLWYICLAVYSMRKRSDYSNCLSLQWIWSQWSLKENVAQTVTETLKSSWFNPVLSTDVWSLEFEFKCYLGESIKCIDPYESLLWRCRNPTLTMGSETHISDSIVTLLMPRAWCTQEKYQVEMCADGKLVSIYTLACSSPLVTSFSYYISWSEEFAYSQ